MGAPNYGRCGSAIMGLRQAWRLWRAPPVLCGRRRGIPTGCCRCDGECVVGRSRWAHADALTERRRRLPPAACRLPPHSSARRRRMQRSAAERGTCQFRATKREERANTARARPPTWARNRRFSYRFGRAILVARNILFVHSALYTCAVRRPARTRSAKDTGRGRVLQQAPKGGIASITLHTRVGGGARRRRGRLWSQRSASRVG